MAIKKYNPTSPARRLMSVASFDEITATKPEKSLIQIRKNHAGRNNQGKITIRHRGGGHKRFYRIIDFKRNKLGIPGKVATIEYDPNRSARIAWSITPTAKSVTFWLRWASRWAITSWPAAARKCASATRCPFAPSRWAPRSTTSSYRLGVVGS